MNRFAIIGLSVISLAPLSGCFNTYVESAQLAAIGITSAISLAPNTPENTVVHRHQPLRNVCIEFNKSVAINDFVPALQNELIRRGIENRVYSEGMAPTSCDATLNYSAQVKWEMRGFMEPAYTPYISFATISFRKDGAMIASAQYQVGMMGYDKWASPARKIGGILDEMLVSCPTPPGALTTIIPPITVCL
jgi:hypothetical protein